MTGVLIIFYNVPDFLIKQKEHLDRFMQDEFKLIVVDNSSDSEASEGIKYHAKKYGLEYIRTIAGSTNGSDSHAFSLCFAYRKYATSFEQLLIMDHDSFLIKPFSVTQTLAGKKMAGLGQDRNGETYYWPGCCMFKSGVKVDFSLKPGADTGANSSKAIQSAGIDNCVFFDEAHVQNPSFNKSQYNFYSLINNGTWMHFINGSNWAKSEENTERLNSLFNILSGYLNP